MSNAKTEDRYWLVDYNTTARIREATAEERAESEAQAQRFGGAGVILVDGRRCFVETTPIAAVTATTTFRLVPAGTRDVYAAGIDGNRFTSREEALERLDRARSAMAAGNRFLALARAAWRAWRVAQGGSSVRALVLVAATARAARVANRRDPQMAEVLF